MKKNIKILIVDDDADTLTTLSDLLIEVGYNVIVAADGEQGLNTAEQEKPDLALLDIRLPKIDGYEVCWRIKQMKESDIKVVLFTAYGDAVSVANAKKVGADNLLGKTDDFANILRTIKALI